MTSSQTKIGVDSSIQEGTRIDEFREIRILSIICQQDLVGFPLTSSLRKTAQIPEARLAATRGARHKGGWRAELEPVSAVHTLVAVKADTGVVGVIFTSYLLSLGGSITQAISGIDITHDASDAYWLGNLRWAINASRMLADPHSCRYQA